MPIPFGSPGVETAAPLAYSEGVAKRGMPITWLARVMSENPARIFGLYPRKGSLQVGTDADLTIIDPQDSMVVRAKDHHGNTGFSLFEGWELSGKPWMSLVRGQVLLDRGRLAQKPGFGKVPGVRQPAGSPGRPGTLNGGESLAVLQSLAYSSRNDTYNQLSQRQLSQRRKKMSDLSFDDVSSLAKAAGVELSQEDLVEVTHRLERDHRGGGAVLASRAPHHRGGAVSPVGRTRRGVGEWVFAFGELVSIPPKRNSR